MKRSAVTTRISPPTGPVIGAAVAFILMAGAAAMVRVPDAPATTTPTAPPALTVARLADFPRDGALREQMALFDPAPLYLPRPGASGAFIDGAPSLPEGEIARAVPPALVFAENRPTDRLPRPSSPTTPEQAADLASAARWFSGLARGPDVTPAIASSYSPSCTLRRIGEADDIAVVSLSLPATMSATQWAPFEFTVLVDAAGSALVTAAATGSVADDLEESIRERLRTDIVPPLRLRPGLYRAFVTP